MSTVGEGRPINYYVTKSGDGWWFFNVEEGIPFWQNIPHGYIADGDFDTNPIRWLIRIPVNEIDERSVIARATVKRAAEIHRRRAYTVEGGHDVIPGYIVVAVPNPEDPECRIFVLFEPSGPHGVGISLEGLPDADSRIWRLYVRNPETERQLEWFPTNTPPEADREFFEQTAFRLIDTCMASANR